MRPITIPAVWRLALGRFRAGPIFFSMKTTSGNVVRSRAAPMSDNSRIAGPAGQPCATASFVGSAVAAPQPSGRSDEDPTISMKKLAPWPAPGESRVHGPLSIDHVDEYVSRVFRPPDPAAKAIELELERIRLKQDRYRLKSAVEQLARDRKELRS